LVGIVPAQEGEYETNVKWLNLFADLDSFRVYRQRGELTFGGWMRELRGPKVYSNYAADDPLPGLYAVAESLAQRRPVRPLLERARRMFPKASNDD
jgi:predicted ATP-grasp superfamily ATP-dependent carboligase